MIIEHKISIFISSKCNGKYEIMRKALKQLLLETGLADVYCFETEPGASDPMPDAYLGYVDLSQLLVLIVDNKDNISDGTMAEYKRARELGIRTIAVFCDEESRTPTEVEKEIMMNQSCKFVHASKFSDIAQIAYQSVIQDLANVYRKKPIEISTKPVPDVGGLNVLPNNLVAKNVLKEFYTTKRTIYKSFYAENNEEAASDIDALFQKFLMVVLCRSHFNQLDFNYLKTLILKKHDAQIGHIVEKRLEALNAYYTDNIAECIQILDNLIETCKDNLQIPRWIYNDIAIDLRNMILLLDSKNGSYVFNKGQNIIDTSSEYLYFPSIDRIVSNLKSNLLKEYNRINFQSPYTTNLGGVEEIFSDIASCFCLALLYGSITHLKMIRSYMAEALEVISQEFDDANLSREFVRMLILQNNNKTLRAYIRTYNRAYEIIAPVEIDEIINGISNLPMQIERNAASLLLIEALGYYMSDDQFNNQITWLNNFTEVCIRDGSSAFTESIRAAIENSCQRMPSDLLANRILLLLKSNTLRFKDIACELLGYTDIKTLPIDIQEALAFELEKNFCNAQHMSKLHYGILIFCKNTSTNLADFEQRLAEQLPKFYNGDYQLEIHAKNKSAMLEGITNSIDNIKNRTEIQGKNGRYIGFASDPFVVIENIIRTNDMTLSWKELKPIFDATKGFLLSPNQSCGEKFRAISLLTFLFLQNKKSKKLYEALKSLTAEQEKILAVFDMNIFETTSLTTLSFALNFLIIFMGTTNQQQSIVELSNIHFMDNKGIIDCMQYISNVLTIVNFSNIPDEITSTLLELSISLFANKERDVRFLSTKCLIELTRSKYQEVALKQLSRCMDEGSAEIKMAIISRIKQVTDASEIKKYIIKKALTDNHYLVRKIAEEQ